MTVSRLQRFSLLSDESCYHTRQRKREERDCRGAHLLWDLVFVRDRAGVRQSAGLSQPLLTPCLLWPAMKAMHRKRNKTPNGASRILGPSTHHSART